MPKFSTTSKQNLASCHPAIQKVLNKVIQSFDCTVICGHRGKAEQTKAFKNKKSKLEFPNSNHNELPSMAVDVMPYPINWVDINTICYFAGFVVGTARTMNIRLRWGGDFNKNNLVGDQKFFDGPHFELLLGE